jgi:hypothetical protein
MAQTFPTKDANATNTEQPILPNNNSKNDIDLDKISD